MDRKLVKNVINRGNLVKIGHFGGNGENLVILWAKKGHISKLREIGQIIFSLKVSLIYFS